MGVAKVANNKNDLVKQGRNCRIARATLNHWSFRQHWEEVCRYKFEVT